MSIAVTTVVRPSRWLLVIVTVAWFCLILIAGLVGFNYLGLLSAWERSFIVIAYVFVASACWSFFFFAQKSYLITISSTGQIRLLELVASVDNALIILNDESSDKFIVNLQDDSTLWPKLLLLRLRSDNGRLTILCILQDSVSLQSFRSLSVASRWITARVKRDINKI